MRFLVLALALCLFCPTQGQFLRWILGLTHDHMPEKSQGAQSGGSSATNPETATAVPESHIPYEAPIESDDTFLTEAKTLLATETDLTPLDMCLHKVVLHLKANCARMNEEELARFSIDLLNCQASYEGRRVYPCYERMTLRECTSSMDGDTWNAYQLFATRARAVCATLRQQQFRLLTELAVNKLMVATKDQLLGMANLQSQQKQLGESFEEAVNHIRTGNEQLLEQQGALASAQELVANKISSNLEHLAQEKALIAAGHSEVAATLGRLKSRIDETLEELTSQSVAQRNNHLEVTADLKSLDDTISAIQRELSSALIDVLNQQVVSSKMQDDSLASLAVINDTVSYLSEVAAKTKSQVDWMQAFLTSTGGDIHTIKAWATHTGYLIGGMLALPFLQAPVITRLALLLVLPANLVAELGHQDALDWKSLIILLTGITLVYEIFRFIWHYITRPRKAVIDKKTVPAVEEKKADTSDAEKHFVFRSSDLPLRRPSIHDYDYEGITQLNSTAVDDRGQETLLAGSFRPSAVEAFEDSPSVRGITRSQRAMTTTPEPRIPTSFRNFTPDTSSLLGTPRRRSKLRLCGAQTRSGAPCRNPVPGGDSFCFRHENGRQSVAGDSIY